ncbi:MAG TPA: glycosyltransferase family 4 protein [Solirubrobacteraceae bacterium]|nr:glycosyltransferase family 4 protein [Solirubrobacteraceae bacterium]
MLAPPWIPVPAPGYGGVETVVSSLTEAFVDQGHDVTLLCAPGSRSGAHVVTLLDEAHPEEIERSLHEADHVARAFAVIERGQFDVVHDHCGFTAVAMADRLATPLVHTLHGQFTASTAAFYAHHGRKATIVAISRTQIQCAPPELRVVAAIPNPIDLRAWRPKEHKGDYVLWIGRMTEVKGPHRAIAAARAAGVPLILAGVIQPGQQAFFDREIAPHIDGDRVRFVGEVGGAAKHSLFADARALLMPIRWEEPFGMVMVEALACGTPVIAFPEGAARELVVHGQTGFLVDDEAAMAAAVSQLDRISPAACRTWAAAHCDVEVVSRAYEQVFRDAILARSEVRAARA